MGLRVVDEGVVCREESTMATNLCCDLHQGLLFARPGPPFPALAGGRILAVTRDRVDDSAGKFAGDRLALLETF